MQQRKTVAKLVRQERLIGIMRTQNTEVARRVAYACIEGGIRLIEVPLTVPQALHLIQELSALSQVCVGAGSVLNAEAARKAIAYGARYIISPHTEPEVIEICEEEDVFVASGALTPTEVLRAWNLGVDAVKVFPAQAVGGPDYIRALKGPFPFMELLPSGGVTLDNCQAYLEAGALAVGVTHALMEQEAIHRGDWSKIRERAQQFVARLRSPTSQT